MTSRGAGTRNDCPVSTLSVAPVTAVRRRFRRDQQPQRRHPGVRPDRVPMQQANNLNPKTGSWSLPTRMPHLHSLDSTPWVSSGRNDREKVTVGFSAPSPTKSERYGKTSRAQGEEPSPFPGLSTVAQGVAGFLVFSSRRSPGDSQESIFRRCRDRPEGLRVEACDGRIIPDQGLPSLQGGWAITVREDTGGPSLRRFGRAFP